MRLVDVETAHALSAAEPARPAAHDEDHRATNATTAPAKRRGETTAARTTKAEVHNLAAGAALALHLIAHFSNSVLHLAGIERGHLTASHGPGDSYGFVISFRRQASVRQPGRS